MLRKLRSTIKQRLSPILAPFYQGCGSILMFHRILPDDGRPRVHTRALEVSPERLEKFIEYFKQRNYDFIKMDQVEYYLKNKRKNKFVVFTFDDGYVDNYTIAYPLFKKYNVPFTIYITTDFPDHKQILWHYLLEELLLRNDNLKLKLNENDISVIELKTQEQKEKAFNELRRFLIDLPEKTKLDRIQEWFSDIELDPYDLIKNHSMTWEQINQLSKDPLVEIGAHTVTHPSLSTLTKDKLFFELTSCADRIEEKTNSRPSQFAYPFGSKNEIKEREVRMLEESEYKTSVTTREGNIFRVHLKCLHALPRIYISPHTSLEDLHSFVSGKTPFIRNTFKRLITI